MMSPRNAHPAARRLRGPRRALVTGYNYPGTDWELNGCVSDAGIWKAALEAKGFAVTLLGDGTTRDVVLDTLLRLGQSAPTGHLAYVNSSHGTYLPDVSGDEADHYDEAMCPPDFPAGNFFTDDHNRTIAAQLPPEVGYTVIADSCYSGTIGRFAGPAVAPVRESDTRRARFLPTRHRTRELFDAYRERYYEDVRSGRVDTAVVRAAREGRKGRNGREAVAGASSLLSVAFSACKDSQVAYESKKVGGTVTGDFTAIAVPILLAAGTTMTRDGFLRRIHKAFGPSAQQTPTLDAAPGMGKLSMWAATHA